MYAAILYIGSIASHILVLTLLSARRWQLVRQSAGKHAWVVPTAAIKFSGTIVGLATLALPYAGPTDPFPQCGVRVASFFYAFKLLDLALTKSDDPPRLLAIPDNSAGSFVDQAKYVWLILTEMRYFSFDIRTLQKGRPAEGEKGRHTRNVLTLLVLTSIAYAVPVAETKCLLLLCIIQNALETLHTILHPRCSHYLFYAPFTAATLGDFWTIHWHASAVFLQSLAYKPGRRMIGRAFGVLAAFALSGVWHGWAAAPLAEDEFALKLGLQVWWFFLMLGVGTLLERMIWQEKQGGWLQRALVWLWALAWAGWCFRTLESHSKVAFLRTR